MAGRGDNQERTRRQRGMPAYMLVLTILALLQPDVQALPNLVTTSVTTEEEAIRPGKLLHVHWVVENLGAERSTHIRHDQLYLSTDPVIGDDDPRYSYGYSTVMEPGEHVALTFGLFIPEDLPLATYWVVVETNHEAEVEESTATDNFAISGPVKATQPNLVVSHVVLSEVPVQESDWLTVEWTVTNDSPDIEATGTWRDAVYLASPYPFYSDRELNEAGYFTILQSGQSVALSRSITVPNDVWTGDYCIEVRTDVDRQMPETNERDNTTAVCEIALTGHDAPRMPMGAAKLSSPKGLM